MTTYFQCDLSQGSARTRGYIEQRAASIGNLVEIKEAGFEGLWRVDAVSETGVESDRLFDKQARDRDSLPSVSGNKRPR